MDAWFEKDYNKVSEEDFKIIYAEYQDASGLFLTDDFEKRSFIHHLSSRISYIKIFLRLERDFIKEFQIPFTRDFENLKLEYGYVLKWNNDLEDFENQLKKIESREIKHHTFLEEKIKEIEDSRKAIKKNIKEEEDEISLKKSRTSFIRMLNSLSKIGFKIDKKSTTVEELALMVKQQMEEVESQRKTL